MNLFRLPLLLLLVLCATYSAGQNSYRKTFPSAYSFNTQDIRALHNGNLLLGTYGGNLTGNLMHAVTCVDPQGNILWSNFYDNPNIFTITKVIESTAHDLFYGISMMNEVAVIKADINGNPLWTKIYSSYAAIGITGMCASPEGGFVFTGQGCTGSIITKCDSSGNVIWQNDVIHNGTSIYPYTIVRCASGGYILTGYKWIGQDKDIIILRIDEQGGLKWFRQYEHLAAQQVGGAIVELPSGDFIVGGHNTTNMVSDIDMSLFRIDSLGNLEWSKVLAAPVHNYPKDMAAMGESVFIAGTYNDEFHYLVCDSAGNISEAATDSISLASDIMVRVEPSGNGGFFIATNGGIAGLHYTDTPSMTFCEPAEAKLSQLPLPLNALNPPLVINNASLVITPASVNVVGTPFTVQDECSSDLGIDEPDARSALAVYPNPAGEKVYIDPGDIHDGELFIFNISGSLIGKLHINEEQQAPIDVSGLPPGVYTVQLKSSYTRTGKLVIIR